MTRTPPADDARIEFLSVLARALSRFGEDVDDLERDLHACADALALPAQFYATPTLVMASFGGGVGARTTLIRLGEGGIDLQNLNAVHDVLEHVCAGTKTVAQGLAELRLLLASPPRFAWWLRVLGSGLGAASFAVFLGGDWRTFLMALPVGLGVGAMVVVAARYARLSRLMELLAGFFASVLTLLLAHLVHHVSLPTVALSGVILLLPGLAITIGVAELASRHLQSGTARLAGAAVTLVNLGVGSFLGYAVVDKLDFVPGTGLVAPSQTTAAFIVAVAVNAAALMVLTNSRTRDYPLVLAAVVVALLGSRFGAWLVGASLGVAVAAVVVGLAGNLYARVTRRAASVFVIPGLAVLVPGALGLRGVSEFLRSAAGGVDVLTSVLIIAAGLVVGLMVADATLPPRGGRTMFD